MYFGAIQIIHDILGGVGQQYVTQTSSDYCNTVYSGFLEVKSVFRNQD